MFSYEERINAIKLFIQYDKSYSTVIHELGYPSNIFISQFAPAGWHLNIGEGTIAGAVLDRIVHSSYEILIDGQISMRERKSFKK